MDQNYSYLSFLKLHLLEFLENVWSMYNAKNKDISQLLWLIPGKYRSLTLCNIDYQWSSISSNYISTWKFLLCFVYTISFISSDEIQGRFFSFQVEERLLQILMVNTLFILLLHHVVTQLQVTFMLSIVYLQLFFVHS